MFSLRSLAVSTSTLSGPLGQSTANRSEGDRDRNGQSYDSTTANTR